MSGAPFRSASTPPLALLLAAAIAVAAAGRAAAQSVSPDWMFESDQADAHLGISAASAGDVNGDGYDDILAGAYFFDDDENGEGRVFLFLGSATGPSASPDWTHDGDNVGAHLGASVATAGDVNGDGHADVIVGARAWSGVFGQSGQVRVFHGSPAGLPTSPDWVVTGDQTSAWLGASVATAGDVNGDGYDDVVVGARLYDNGHQDEGRAYVYLGSATGLSTAPAWSIESDQLYGELGVAVSSAGDVNGDGYDDVVVGAWGVDIGKDFQGQALVFHGSPAGLGASPDWTAYGDRPFARFGAAVASAGDVNADGYDDVVIGCVGCSLFLPTQREGAALVYLGSATGLAASAAWTAESFQIDARMGNAVGASDLNADGYSDVLVGCSALDDDQPDEGAALVYRGSATGPDQNGTRPTGSPANADFAVYGDQDVARLGDSVGSAGDVNADGYDDLIVGTRFWDNGVRDEGAVFVYLGGCTGTDADGDNRCADQAVLDCDDTDPSVWETPGEVRALRFTDPQTLAWSEPLRPGGTTVAYDTLRSPDAGDFDAGAVCVEADDASDRTALDPDLPAAGAVFHYLVRAENGCPAGGQGTLGSRSNGLERTGRDCP